MMESPTDSTTLIRMRKDFDAFLSGGESQIEDSTIRMNLDAAVFSGIKRRHVAAPAAAGDWSSSRSHHRLSDESIKRTLEKEKQEKEKEAALLAARSKIAELETQLSSTKTSKKRARIEFERDLESVKYDRERETEKMLELRSKVRQLAEGEQQAKEALAEGRREWETARQALETKLCALQRERLALEKDLEQAKEEAWQERLELKQEAGRCLSELELMVIELEETKDQLHQQKQQFEQLETKMKDYDALVTRTETAENKVKELEEEVNRQAENAAVTRALREDIDKVPDLEKELVRLRRDNSFLNQEKQNCLLLQEQLTSAQNKLQMAETRRQALTQLQEEHEELKSRLQRWEAMDASGSRRPQSPSELSRRVAELQAAAALSVEQKSKLQASITSLQREVRESREELQKCKGELSAQCLLNQQNADLVKRLRRKLLLISKERDSFKRILDSYESEVTLPLEGSSGSRSKDLEELLAGCQQHSAQLEAQLDQECHKHAQVVRRCSQLEQELLIAQTGSSVSLKADQDRIAQLQGQVLELEEELKKVREEKDILEMRIEQRQLQGDYDPTRTKVLHLALNPAAVAQQQRQQELERLKEEKERLSTRVKLLETAQGPVEDLTEQVDQQLETLPQTKAIEELKMQLAKEELKKQRLMEAFKKTSQEFRETCYQLLGYKIDIVSAGQYRLASMYSQSPRDYLLFKQGESGEIQMLETDFSVLQQDKLETYLQNRDSIPALLSAITLDLFNQQTFSMSYTLTQPS